MNGGASSSGHIAALYSHATTRHLYDPALATLVSQAQTERLRKKTDREAKMARSQVHRLDGEKTPLSDDPTKRAATRGRVDYRA